MNQKKTPDLRAFVWPRESIKRPEQYVTTCRVCGLPWDYIVDIPDYNEKTGFLYRGIGIPRCAKHAWQLVNEFFADSANSTSDSGSG